MRPTTLTTNITPRESTNATKPSSARFSQPRHGFCSPPLTAACPVFIENQRHRTELSLPRPAPRSTKPRIRQELSSPIKNICELVLCLNQHNLFHDAGVKFCSFLQFPHFQFPHFQFLHFQFCVFSSCPTRHRYPLSEPTATSKLISTALHAPRGVSGWGPPENHLNSPLGISTSCSRTVDSSLC